ncbi:MAG: zeta toxin family protein [Proteobacteria bacterium]|nr:zeta toxin family protein [Pseudomonadota bacterium]
MDKPKLYIIAGPNGSGKTTFVQRFLPYYADCTNFVNADLIASGLSPFLPEIAAIKAGKLMIDEIDIFRRRRADFAFETTLSGKTYVKLLKEMKMDGYEVHIFFLWLRNIDLALKRVAERVAMGGHNVPVGTVRRRFDRGLHNLFNLYCHFADSWVIFDNSELLPCVVAKETAGVLTVIDGKLFEEIRAKVETP